MKNLAIRKCSLVSICVLSTIVFNTLKTGAEAPVVVPTKNLSSAYSIKNGNSEDYNFKTTDGANTYYYKIYVNPSKINSPTGNITFSTNSAGAKGSILVKLPNGQNQTVYYFYDDSKISNLSATTPITGEVISNEISGKIFDVSADNAINNYSENASDMDLSGKSLYTDLLNGGVLNSSGGNIGGIYLDSVNNNKGIVNSQNSNIGVISGNFVNNSGYNQNGLVYNDRGNIGNVNLNFIANESDSSNSSSVLTNKSGMITSVTGDFIGNARNQDTTGYSEYFGSAIHNYKDTSSANAFIGSVIGDFVGNRLTVKDNNIAYGGAIANVAGGISTENAVINSINSKFIGNNVQAVNGNVYGGAIYNSGRIGTITADFIQNSVASDTTGNAYGGAIYNSGQIVTIVGSNFNNNSIIAENGTVSGGAIFNKANSLYITDSLFESNYVKGDKADGSAIYNTGSGLTINNSVLKNNIAESKNNAQGGTVYSNGATMSITGSTFESNVSRAQNGSYGGTIFSENTDSITISNSLFKNNSVETTKIGEGDYLFGGAVLLRDSKFNVTGTYTKDGEGNVTDSTTKFISNKAGDINQSVNGYGGAMYLESTAGGNNTRVIDGVIFENNSSNYAGGAISNNGKVDKIAAIFDGNKVQSSVHSANGGALYNDSSAKINEINAVFNNNFVSSTANDTSAYAKGGAIANNGNMADIINSAFSGNHADGKYHAHGGAVYTTSNIEIQDTNFINNYAKVTNGNDSKGGAIYTTDGAVISAYTKDILIKGNKAEQGGAIYNTSTDKAVVLNAQGGNITIEDNNESGNSNGINTGIYSDGGLNISASEGKIVSIDDKLDINGTTSVNGGTLKLGKKAATTNLNILNIAGNTNLDLQNSNVGDVITVSKLTGDGDLTLNTDYNAATGVMDKITVNSGSGKITLNAIKILPGLDGEATETDYMDGVARNNVDVITHTITASTEGWKYTFTPYGDNGHLIVSRVSLLNLTLPEAIASEYYGGSSYTMKNDEIFLKDAGNLDGPTRNFTIFGENKAVNGDGYEGVIVSAPQKLSIQDVSEYKNFKTAVKNSGVLNVKNTTFKNNSVADIDNSGVLNLNSDNNLYKIVGSDGTTNVQSGNTNVGSITQKIINIFDGSKLSVNDIKTTDGVSNSGTLVIKSKNESDISGLGSAIIDGNVDNSGYIGQGVTVNSNKVLTTSANNLGANVVNNGTVALTGGELTKTINGGNILIKAGNTVKSNVSNLAGNITNLCDDFKLKGNLDKRIAGTGTTKVDENLSMTESGSVDGILDLNGGKLNLSADSTSNIYNVGSLKNSNGVGKFGIDIDFTSSDVTSDAINIFSGSNNSGTITLDSINAIGTVRDFNVEVLKGSTDGVTLVLSSALENEYNKTSDWNSTIDSSSLVKDADWADELFNIVEYEQRKKSTISVVDNKNVEYKSTCEKRNEHSIVLDNMAVLNQTEKFGTQERTYTTNDVSNKHVLADDLGTTALGTYTISGVSSGGNKSTVDMNNKEGFVVAKENTILNLNDLFITGLKDNKNGCLVEVKDTAANSKVNMNNVTIDDSVNKAIANNKELNLNGNNDLGTGVAGTGTTNVNSGKTVADNVIQNKINISNGAELDVKSAVADAGVSNDGTLTLNGNSNTNTISGSGTTVIANDLTNTGLIDNKINVNQDKILTSKADLIGGDVQNAGIVDLTGGTLLNVITGGDIKISQNTSTTADNLGGKVTNNSVILELTGGELLQDITGHGNVNINGNVKNSANIENNVAIGSGSELTSNADNISGLINNSGTYNITGGTVSTKISGSGNNNIVGNTIIASNVGGNINVAEDTTLKINPTLGDISSAFKLDLANGSTFDISGNTTTGDNINNMVIANGNTANLVMDWGDKVSTNNIDGHLNVKSIDVTNTNTSPVSYLFTTGPHLDNVGLDENLNLVTNSTSINNVKYYSEGTNAGKLVGYRINLISAVDTTEAGENVIYAMDSNEPAGAASAGVLDAGKLVIQGNGKDVTGYGIIVGDGNTDVANLVVKDASFKNVNGDALHVKGGNSVTLIAENNDMVVSSKDGSSIYLEKNSNGTSNVDINGGSKTVVIKDDILSNDNSNVINLNSGIVDIKGLLDPLTVNVNTIAYRTGSYDEEVTYNLNEGGVLNYSNDAILYDSNHHTPGMLNTINFNGGTLNTMNGAATNFQLANMSLNGVSTFYGDVDLANSRMDRFTVSNPVSGLGTLNVAGLNLISDAKTDLTTINFTDDAVLKAATNYTGPQGITALAPIYKYNVSYDKDSGNFNFMRYGAGGTGMLFNGNSNPSNNFNPAILAAPVAAQLGGYLTQLNSYDEAFRNMDMYMLMSDYSATKDKLVSTYGNLDYDTSYGKYDRKAIWFRPFTNFERVPLKNGPSTDNIAYSTYAGGESQVYEMKNDWKGMLGAYAGYNGSHQSYDNVGIYQNGGTLGILGMAYKGNFFTGLTANAGVSAAEAGTMYGSENMTMLMAGIASKSGYNFELGRGEHLGKYVIQPNMLMSYSFIDTFNYHNAANVGIHSKPINAIQIEPGIKFISNLDKGWQPYAGVSMVWNLMDKAEFQANDLALPDIAVKPFVKYGLGIRKSTGDRFTGFLQTYLTGGGRNGISVQAGLRWALGSDSANEDKTFEKKTIKTQN
ncbi:hypothetical protein IJG72_08535 [bacterium]|nr:hypothetical protein [bacterium]